MLGEVTALSQTTQQDLRGILLRRGEGKGGRKGCPFIFFCGPTPMATAL